MAVLVDRALSLELTRGRVFTLHAGATTRTSAGAGIVRATIAAAVVARLAPEEWALWGAPGVRLDRLLERLLHDHNEDPVATVLRLSVDGRQCQLANETRDDIGRRGPMRKILVRLAEAREETPGQSIGVDEIISAGWPDEVLQHESALNRAYTTMNRLRKSGFGPWINTLDDGYALDLSLEIEWIDP